MKKRLPWWWTEADEAELDLLLWTLVDAYFEHKEHCEVCFLGKERCEQVVEAVREAADWTHFRQLRSKAEALRFLQDRSIQSEFST